MLNTKFLVALALALLSASVAFAQGGMMMMRGPGGTGSDAMNLQRPDVQKELKLSPDTIKKLGEIQIGMQTQMREKFQEMQQGGGEFNQEAMQKMVQDLMKDTEKKQMALLDDSQKKRLHEVAIQIAGNAAILREDVQKDLGLTDDQKNQIKKAQDKNQSEMQGLIEQMRNGELDREELMPKMQKLRESLSEDLGKVLTDANKAKLKELGGAEFKFDKDWRPQMGRPGGGGN